MRELKIEEIITKYNPVPSCIINGGGRVVYANDKMSDVFLYDEIEGTSFFALTGIQYDTLLKSKDSNEELIIERNDRKFKVNINTIPNQESKDSTIVLFIDVTNYEELKKEYLNKQVCTVFVNVDNYDELVSTNSDKNISTIRNNVNALVLDWADEMVASANRLSSNLYIIFVEYGKLTKSLQAKFPILDMARKIKTESDFPVSLSLGIGIGGKDLEETEAFAEAALELALGRGGDQAVVKNKNSVEYFGGILQSVEKSNKGKSRVIAHALKQLIAQSDGIFIMGHKYPDMDAFGAALGINRFCEIEGKSTYIVIDQYDDTLKTIFDAAKATEKYRFINSKKAMELVNKNSLIIVLDTNRESLVECAKLLESSKKIAVIDHHRRAEDYIKNAILYYVESYASSTCELVAEMLQANSQKRTLIKLEAEAMLAGMTIDTNRFAVKTGVRTFEAAAWLRRSGADTTEVKKYFQIDIEDFQVRAQGIANAIFLDGGYAISICEGAKQDAQVINAQVADELLTVKGVKATFVIGTNQFGKVVISARSLGEVNVQIIMEQFGGGGHLTTAGAQVDFTVEEVKDKLMKIIDKLKLNEKK